MGYLHKYHIRAIETGQVQLFSTEINAPVPFIGAFFGHNMLELNGTGAFN
jgi:hypothetical protein